MPLPCRRACGPVPRPAFGFGGVLFRPLGAGVVVMGGLTVERTRARPAAWRILAAMQPGRFLLHYFNPALEMLV